MRRRDVQVEADDVYVGIDVGTGGRMRAGDGDVQVLKRFMAARLPCLLSQNN